VFAPTPFVFFNKSFDFHQPLNHLMHRVFVFQFCDVVATVATHPQEGSAKLHILTLMFFSSECDQLKGI
jgi:hypothetical protein